MVFREKKINFRFSFNIVKLITFIVLKEIIQLHFFVVQ